ncbi:DNA-binding GntR family transcriptional regulator [Tamaricihabitans halophyticus]|uniref:DNA-binding GntR family transcriptional regulator n=1 Tax=Tamaricihabitans halophyticus TaxID=1262583 RepID=A0A4V2STG3_9PSEU|nr:GntR family transcriptional regulator [Tamaricihabitans halophyticus]TCP50026.1 DNA-binding GntR family transcriptional regulator [Tamaricihabitans halophyticus]
MPASDPLASLSPIATHTRGERARAELLSAIVRGQLPPGTVLSDRQLSEVLGVSRTPIREAMHTLEADGLVERSGGRLVVAGFSVRDTRELFELRRLLEPAGLDRLAQTWDEQGVYELATFFDEFPGDLPAGPYDEYLQRDHQFHQLIVAWSGNSRLIRCYDVVETQINRIRHHLAPGYRGRMAEVVQEHRDVCAAIARKDLAGARAALVRHLENGERAMVEFLAARETGAPETTPTH